MAEPRSGAVAALRRKVYSSRKDRASNLRALSNTSAGSVYRPVQVRWADFLTISKILAEERPEPDPALMERLDGAAERTGMAGVVRLVQAKTTAGDPPSLVRLRANFLERRSVPRPHVDHC